MHTIISTTMQVAAVVPSTQEPFCISSSLIPLQMQNVLKYRKLPVFPLITLFMLHTYQEQPEWPQSRRPLPAGRGCRADPPSSGHTSSGRDPAWSRNPRYASSQQRTTLLSYGGKKCLMNVMYVFLLKKVKLQNLQFYEQILKIMYDN